jgi:uncharacterized iron-regulated protein
MTLRTLARLAPLTAAVALAACAPRFDPRLVEAPIAARPWVSTLNVHHPLVGRIWSTRARAFVDEATLDAQLAAADLVALGETHDNPDHHLLQARLLRAVLATGRRPALGFEMLTSDEQPKVDAALARAPRDPDALAAAVGWKDSGWPPFELYRPIFAAGLDAGLPVIAANLPHGKARDAVMKGPASLDPALRARLEREEPIPADVLDGWRAEMSESHCGELPAKMADGLVLAQRARDASMADRMVAAGRGRGAVLVTGSGHARTDRAVPFLAAKDLPGKVVGLAFIEVRKGLTRPEDYAKEWGSGALPFDLVVFTPGAEREDPCKGFKEHMEKRRAREAAKAEKASREAAGMEPAPAGSTSPTAPSAGPGR